MLISLTHPSSERVMTKKIALVPARSGSIRVPDKNIMTLDGHPLLAYTIQAAKNSNLFDAVVLCTDSALYADIGKYYGAIVPALRDKSISSPISPDCEWVEWALTHECIASIDAKYAFILRPTNPFRSSATIIRAWNKFCESNADTLRAVRRAEEHPAKMWVRQSQMIVPLLPHAYDGVPWHSNQTAALFPVLIQDASIEIFTISNFLLTKSITGSSIMPFDSGRIDGFDVNTPRDVELLHGMLASGDAKLEKINSEPWKHAH
jgi:CMP-N,N'-diacetyllegionaminic acid synthase